MYQEKENTRKLPSSGARKCVVTKSYVFAALTRKGVLQHILRETKNYFLFDFIRAHSCSSCLKVTLTL